jgi:hypothetical protein
MSTSTGAPEALARALGIMLRTKGVSANAVPTTPNPLVIASKRRRRGLTPSSLMKPPSISEERRKNKKITRLGVIF